jgi:aminopeptidase N
LLCHEISHQWLGGITSPRSFDLLWMKEATARLLEYTAVSSLFPGWRMWPNFINEVREL